MGSGLSPIAVGRGVAQGDQEEPAEGRLRELARKLHAGTFDELSVDVPIEYEPRSTSSCVACGRIWVGTKAGEIVQVMVSGRKGRREGPADFRVPSGVRTLSHLCEDNGFSSEPLLLVGTDKGSLRFYDRKLKPRPKLSKMLARELDGSESLHPESRNPRNPSFDRGITAFGSSSSEGCTRLLVATRATIQLLEASSGGVRRIWRRSFAAWHQWIAMPTTVDGVATCVSRTGHFLRVRLDGTPDLEPSSLPLLPTSVLPTGIGADPGQRLFVGTPNGLFAVKLGAEPSFIAIPVTRAGVLSMDRASFPVVGDVDRELIFLGLDDGRVRVVDRRRLEALAKGVRPTEGLSWSIRRPSAVLEIEALERADASAGVHLLAAGRDDGIRLFEILSPERTRAELLALDRPLCQALRAFEAKKDSLAVTDVRNAVDELLRAVRSTSDERPVRYMVADVVLPRLVLAESGPASAVELACELLKGAEPALVDRIAAEIANICRGRHGWDVDPVHVIRLTFEIMSSAPRDDRWRPFVQRVLAQVHTLISASSDASRVVNWARFVRKYLALGSTFSKALRLRRLVDINRRNKKWLDALIYAAQLHHKKYDVIWRTEWSTVEDQFRSSSASVRVVKLATASLIVVLSSDAQVSFLRAEGGQVPHRLDVNSHRGRRSFLSLVDERATALAFAAVPRGDTFDLFASVEVATSSGGEAHVVVVTAEYKGDGVVISEPMRARAGAAVRVPPGLVYSLAVLPFKDGASVVSTASVGMALLEIARRADGKWHARDCVPAGPDQRADWRAQRASAARRHRKDGTVLLAVGADNGDVALYTAQQERITQRCELTLRGGLRFAEAITAVELWDHPRGHWCVLIATDDGILACFELYSPEGDPQGTFDTRPLWRDTFETPVVQLRATASPHHRVEVLYTLTRAGRLCVHALSREAAPVKSSTSALNHYLFAGMRLDRLTLPSPDGELAFLDDGAISLAGRELCGLDLRYARDASGRKELEGLMSRLYGRADVDETGLFNPAEDRDVWHADLLELLHGEHGSLRLFVRRARLTMRGAWIDPAAVLKAAFATFDIGLPESRELLKITLRSLGDRVFGEPLHEFAKTALERTPEEAARRDAAVLNAVSALREQLAQHDGRHGPAYSRIRLAAVKEVFRSNVWLALANEEEDGPLSQALCGIIGDCLRHDDPLVRMDVLRAVGVGLRDMAVVCEAREAFRQRLFPRGIHGLRWLLQPLASAAGYRGQDQPAIASPLWYYASVLVVVGKLFPDDIEDLCKMMVSHGARSILRLWRDRLPRHLARPREVIGEYAAPCGAGNETPSPLSSTPPPKSAATAARSSLVPRESPALTLNPARLGRADDYRKVRLLAEEPLAAIQAFVQGLAEKWEDRAEPSSSASHSGERHASAPAQQSMSRKQQIDKAIYDAVRVLRQRPNQTILLLGESGTGKTHVVSEIASILDRDHIVIDVHTLPQGTVESALFGHVRGAFTGAVSDYQGRIRSVGDDGVVLLDEFGDIPEEVQGKFLRVLDKGTVTPMGGNAEYPVNVSFVCATNKDLAAAVDGGLFREDLYFRISSGLSITLPPLGGHGDHIEELARFFAGERKRELSSELIEKLRGHEWPGNVRTLQTTINTAIDMCAESVLQPEDVKLRRPKTTAAEAPNMPQCPTVRAKDSECVAALKRMRDYLAQSAPNKAQLNVWASWCWWLHFLAAHVCRVGSGDLRAFAVRCLSAIDKEMPSKKLGDTDR